MTIIHSKSLSVWFIKLKQQSSKESGIEFIGVITLNSGILRTCPSKKHPIFFKGIQNEVKNKNIIDGYKKESE